MLSTALREIFDKEEYYEKEVECLLVFYRRNVIVHRYELMYCGMRRGSEKSTGQSFRWGERRTLGRLPQASVPGDQNFEFVAWLVGGERKQPGDKITVDSALVITSVTQRKAPVKVKDGE